METEPSIRVLTERDARSLAAFYASLSAEVRWFYEPFSDPTVEVLGAHLREGDSGEHVVLGLVERARVFGHAFVLHLAGERPVLGIGLHQDMLGRGWGRKLMVEILARTDAMGVPLVTLTVVKNNERAWRLYESLGFVRTGECSFRAENDSLRMERRRA